jgi:anaerobic selenocysteine-containing dehydrogenase
MSNTSRRSFLKATAAVVAAAHAGAGRLAARPVGVPIGLQLYSMRKLSL